MSTDQTYQLRVQRRAAVRALERLRTEKGSKAYQQALDRVLTLSDALCDLSFDDQ